MSSLLVSHILPGMAGSALTAGAAAGSGFVAQEVLDAHWFPKASDCVNEQAIGLSAFFGASLFVLATQNLPSPAFKAVSVATAIISSYVTPIIVAKAVRNFDARPNIHTIALITMIAATILLAVPVSALLTPVDACFLLSLASYSFVSFVVNIKDDDKSAQQRY